MPPYSPDYTSGSSSVFPEAILPSIVVISLLVLITFVGAVIIFVRAYKQRKHRRLSQQEKNRPSKMGAGGSIIRETDEGDNVNALKTGRRFFGSLFSRNRETGVSRFQPPVAIMTGESKMSSHNVREIVQGGSQRERGSVNWRTGDAVRVGPGYHARYSRETPDMDIYESMAVPVIPAVGKIERMTGNALSNDLYADRASGAVSPRENRTLTHSKSVPEWRKLSRIVIPGTPPPWSLRLDTNSSAISLATDETPVVQDLSPNYENLLGLSPPPRVATALIDRKYPNVAALARANIPSAKPSSLLSCTYSCGNPTVHIATQYDPTSRSRRTLSRSSSNMAPLPDPPRSAAFGSFTGRPRSSKSKGKQSLRDSAESTTPMDLPIPFHRGSWSGRSVLELDAPEDNTKKATLPPLPPQPINSSPQSTVPKFATTPRIRTPALGSPLDPLLPPTPSILFSTWGISHGNRSDAALPRPYSASRISMASIPSTISSFNAVTVPANPIHGLSPTPPRSGPSAAALEERLGESIGTLIADTPEVSDFTERELEVEMARIRDRARKASDERRWRRREEERWRGGDYSWS